MSQVTEPQQHATESSRHTEEEEDEHDHEVEIVLRLIATIKEIAMRSKFIGAPADDKDPVKRAYELSIPSSIISHAAKIHGSYLGSDVNQSKPSTGIKTRDTLDNMYRGLKRELDSMHPSFIRHLVLSLNLEQVFATSIDLHCQNVTVPRFILRFLEIPSEDHRLSSQSIEDLSNLIDHEELVRRLCYEPMPSDRNKLAQSQTAHTAAAHPSPDLLSFITFCNTVMLLLSAIVYHGFLHCIINVWRSPYAVKLDHREIRLLRFVPTPDGEDNSIIRCQFLYTLVDCPDEPYDALSYCWGLPTQAQTIIYLNNEPIMVYESLFLALEQLKKSTRPLWIDALCIQQSNLLEKNDQIPLMGEIYARATTVIIWLGVDADDSSFTLECLQEGNASLYMEPRVLKGIYHLLGRPWFTRVWIVQELVLASPEAPVLMTGSVCVKWSRFAEVVMSMYHGPVLDTASQELDGMLVASYKDGSLTDAKRLSLRLQHIDWYQGRDLVRHTFNESRARSLINLRRSGLNGLGRGRLSNLILSRRCQASDPRDKIYGLFALIRDDVPREFVVDYRASPASVYRATTMVVAESNPGDYRSFLYCMPVYGKRRCFGDFVPSWTLDFASNDEHAGLRLHPENLDVNISPWQDRPTFREHTQDSHTFRIQTCRIGIIRDVVERPELGDLQSFVRLMLWPQPWAREVKSTPVREYYAEYEDIVQQKAMARERSVTCFVHFIEHIAALRELSTVHRRGRVAKEQASLWKILLTGRFGRDISDEEADHKFNVLIGKSVLPDEHTRSDRSEAISRFKFAQPLSVALWQRVSPIESCRLSFFTTSSGLCGLCAPGAQVGDDLILLLRDEECPDVPYIARRLDEEHHAMIAVAWVQDDWEEVCEGQGPFETQPYKFK